MIRHILCGAMLAGLMLTGPGARMTRQSAPTADDITISVAPGDTVAIPFSGSDPDGDLFGFFPTSAPAPAEGGTFFSLCFCGLSFPGGTPICACSSTFTASSTFSGTVTFTYRAVDTTGLESADATVTINVGSALRTFQQILAEIEHLIARAEIGGLIKPNIASSLLAKIKEAERLENEGKFKAAERAVHAFADEAAALSGKGLDPLVAKSLLLCAAAADKAFVLAEMKRREFDWELFLAHFYAPAAVPTVILDCLHDSLTAWAKVLEDPRVFEGNKLAVFDAADEEFSTCAHGSHPTLTGDADHINITVVGVGVPPPNDILDIDFTHWALSDVSFNVGHAGGTLEMHARENGQNWWEVRGVLTPTPFLDTAPRRLADGSLFKVETTVRLPSGVVTTKIRLIHMAPPP